MEEGVIEMSTTVLHSRAAPSLECLPGIPELSINIALVTLGPNK